MGIYPKQQHLQTHKHRITHVATGGHVRESTLSRPRVQSPAMQMPEAIFQRYLSLSKSFHAPSPSQSFSFSSCVGTDCKNRLKQKDTNTEANQLTVLHSKQVGVSKTWNPPKPSKMVSTLLVNPDSIPFSLDTLKQSTTHTRTHSSFGAKSTERQRQFLQRAGHIALQQHKVFLQDATHMVADVWILQILHQDRREDLECSKFDPNN